MAHETDTIADLSSGGSSAGSGWQARLDMGFSHTRARTVLDLNRHTGPLRVQRPFYPEQSVCHAYVLHPPGGVVGGDRLEINARVSENAEVLITTPGAAKFYRTGGSTAVQSISLAVSAGGRLEWFPQETLVYPGADVETTTRFALEPGGAVIGWEILCIGLPACGQPFTGGRLVSTLEITRDASPLFIDRLNVSGQPDLERPSGLRGHTVCATFVATGADSDILGEVRSVLDSVKAEDPAGATLIEDLLVVRYLSHSSERTKGCFQTLWTRIRPRLFGRKPCPPRIWAT